MRLGLISDIHEDIIRLGEALRCLERRKVDDVICLGDMVGYSVPHYGFLESRDADAVIDTIRATCSDVVVGNHDLYAIRKLPENRSYFAYPADWYALDFQVRRELSAGKIFLYESNELSSLLSSRNSDYLRSLPEFVVKPCGDHDVLLTHYAFPDCTGSSTLQIRHVSILDAHFCAMRHHGCVIGFSGNDHVEGLKICSGVGIRSCGFEPYEVGTEIAWIDGPAVAQGAHCNGIMIYDSTQRIVEAVALKSPLRTMTYRLY